MLVVGRRHGAGRRGSDDGDHIGVVACLFDHEEVGSESTTGAAGPLLETVLDRLVLARGGTAEDRHRALAASSCVSADMAHAVHPNYPERHEPGHRPLPNAGPVLKVNANQRYATDAVTRGALHTGLPGRGRAVAGVRVPQLDALRLHHRAAHGHPPRHPHRRRRLRPAVHALGPRAVRRRRPGLLVAALGAYLAGA